MATITTTTRTAFAERVRHARTARAMNVGVIEDRAGIGRRSLWKLERGTDQHACTVLRLARAMDVDIAWLVDDGPIDRDARVPWCEVLPDVAAYSDAARLIGGRIRDARRSRGWKQLELSRRAGSGSSVVGQYEIARHAPLLSVARRLARALDVERCAG
jgi:transcriptional regulator with XRE-family HTH domain